MALVIDRVALLGSPFLGGRGVVDLPQRGAPGKEVVGLYYYRNVGVWS